VGKVIWLVGGGSGGHITPLVSIAERLKSVDPGLRLVSVAERGSSLDRILKQSDNIDRHYSIFAGKLRRYHGESWLRRLRDYRTIAYNLRDIVYLGLGFFEALWLMLKHRPDVIFVKGGFVGVPIGLAARLLRVDYYTHDSDYDAGLANRIIAGGAIANLVGQDAEHYSYPKSKLVKVGVPLAGCYSDISRHDVILARTKLGIARGSKLVFVTGGGLGAQAISDIMLDIFQKHTDEIVCSKIVFVVQTGSVKASSELVSKLPVTLVESEQVIVKGFVSDMFEHYVAADIVVSRASTTNLAEVGSIGRPLILIAAPHLSGGHQLKNAKQYADAGMAISLDEKSLKVDSSDLLLKVKLLLDQPKFADSLSKVLHQKTIANASSVIAKLLLTEPGGK
jgi:UDP-N-acetylglucosamine--N-acetylmuramyl-(pentapeptide) pyrophosphoryl-undecaprenol N-acetylglucosamine transferase